MQSGKIKKFQLSSYAAATQESLTKARLFGPDGWRPDDGILANPSNVVIPGTSLSQILSSPIFFQITFEKMKKIFYFVIQDSPPSQPMRYSQSFYIAYNDAEWKTYGGSKAQVLLSALVYKTFSLLVLFDSSHSNQSSQFNQSVISIIEINSIIPISPINPIIAISHIILIILIKCQLLLLYLNSNMYCA